MTHLELTKPFQSRELAKAIVKKINKLSVELSKKGFEKINIMHVCGTHEHTITYYGLRALLPENINVIAGPGCPVCIVPAREIDEAIKLAKEGIRIFTYGDMYRVPGSYEGLSQAKAQGARVTIVYGFLDAIRLAQKSEEETVFFGVGFETTAPTTASFIVNNKVPKNLSILMSYRITVPAVEYILSAPHNLNGIICPGHVSTIIGAGAWSFISEKYELPTVVAGFEPIDVLLAILYILEQLINGKAELINEYKRVVKWEGNQVAKKYLSEAFMVADRDWRGIGVIPNSGWLLNDKYDYLDAREKFNVKIDKWIDIKGSCKCADVVLGRAIPTDCPYFGTSCTPQHPIGACMVSSEGTCSIWYKYGGHMIRKMRKDINTEGI